MGKSTKVEAAQPDPAIGQAALMQAKLGEEQLEFMREVYAGQEKRQARLDDMSIQISDDALKTSREQAQWARDDRQRYQDVVAPMEDEFYQEARSYDSYGRQTARANEAAADVQSSAAMQRQATQRSQAAMGVDPRSGRYAGVDRAGEIATALGTAGASNNARNQVRQQGLALRADAVNIGRGLPAQSANAAALGLSAGNSAMGATATAMNAANSNAAMMQSGFNAASSGYGAQANTLNSLYGNQLQAQQMQQQAAAYSSAGLGQTVGAAAGIAAMFM